MANNLYIICIISYYSKNCLYSGNSYINKNIKSNSFLIIKFTFSIYFSVF